MKIKIALHTSSPDGAFQIAFENDKKGESTLVLLNTDSILAGAAVDSRYCEYELPMNIFRKALAIAVELHNERHGNDAQGDPE